MSAVSATININAVANTKGAAAQLAQLQAQLKSLAGTMAGAGAAGTAAQRALSGVPAVMADLNSRGWTTGVKNMTTEAGRLQKALDKGTASQDDLRKMTRGSSVVQAMAADRVRTLQTRYASLGQAVDGTQRVMKATPNQISTSSAAVQQFGTAATMAAQQAQIMSQRSKLMAQNTVNAGKNMQWAGRQMVVGFGVPFALAAGGAVSAFAEVEEASIAFKRVYGDFSTTSAQKSAALKSVMDQLVGTMTDYGIAAKDTIDVSARVAAVGYQGEDMLAVTKETLRLATLGQMDYNTALEATIAVQTAFDIKAQDMARTTDFLNAAENQTILSMEDMAIAFPRAASVIRGFSGDVEDLAFLMVGLREGGVKAEHASNSLKSMLSSMVKPTKQTSDMIENLGMNYGKVEKALNSGNLITAFKEMDVMMKDLGQGDRQRFLTQAFGKYQYARATALFKSLETLRKGGDTQLDQIEKLDRMSDQKLASISEGELGEIAKSNLTKMKGAFEDLKVALVPIGDKIAGIIATLLDGVTAITKAISGSDIATNIVLWGAAFLGLFAVGKMLLGVFLNLVGSLRQLGRGMLDMARGTKYLTTDALTATAAQRDLSTASNIATTSLQRETAATHALSNALLRLAGISRGMPGRGGFGPGGGPGGGPAGGPVGGPGGTPRGPYGGGYPIVPGGTGSRGPGSIITGGQNTRVVATGGRKGWMVIPAGGAGFAAAAAGDGPVAPLVPNTVAKAGTGGVTTGGRGGAVPTTPATGPGSNVSVMAGGTPRQIASKIERIRALAGQAGVRPVVPTSASTLPIVPGSSSSAATVAPSPRSLLDYNTMYRSGRDMAHLGDSGKEVKAANEAIRKARTALSGPTPMSGSAVLTELNKTQVGGKGLGSLIMSQLGKSSGSGSRTITLSDLKGVRALGGFTMSQNADINRDMGAGRSYSARAIGKDMMHRATPDSIARQVMQAQMAATKFEGKKAPVHGYSAQQVARFANTAAGQAILRDVYSGTERTARQLMGMSGSIDQKQLFNSLQGNMSPETQKIMSKLLDPVREIRGDRIDSNKYSLAGAGANMGQGKSREGVVKDDVRNVAKGESDRTAKGRGQAVKDMAAAAKKAGVAFDGNSYSIIAGGAPRGGTPPPDPKATSQAAQDQDRANKSGTTRANAEERAARQQQVTQKAIAAAPAPLQLGAAPTDPEERRRLGLPVYKMPSSGGERTVYTAGRSPGSFAEEVTRQSTRYGQYSPAHGAGDHLPTRAERLGLPLTYNERQARIAQLEEGRRQIAGVGSYGNVIGREIDRLRPVAGTAAGRSATLQGLGNLVDMNKRRSPKQFIKDLFSRSSYKPGGLTGADAPTVQNMTAMAGGSTAAGGGQDDDKDKTSKKSGPGFFRSRFGYSALQERGERVKQERADGKAGSALAGRLQAAGMAGMVGSMAMGASGKDMPSWMTWAPMGVMAAGMMPGLASKALGGGLVGMAKAGSLGGGAIAGKLAGLGTAATGLASGFMSFAAPVALAAGTFYLLNKAADHVINVTRDAGKNIAVNGDAVRAHAEELGKETRMQRENRLAAQRAASDAGVDVDKKDMADGKAFLQSGSGQKFLESVNNANKFGGEDAAIGSIANQVSALVAEGFINRKTAVSRGVALAEAAGLGPNAVLEVTGKIVDIVGAKGLPPIEIDANIKEATLTGDAISSAANRNVEDTAEWIKWVKGPGSSEMLRQRGEVSAMVAAAVEDTERFFNADDFDKALDEKYGADEERWKDAWGTLQDEITDKALQKVDQYGDTATLFKGLTETAFDMKSTTEYIDDRYNLDQYGINEEAMRKGEMQMRTGVAQGFIDPKFMNQVGQLTFDNNSLSAMDKRGTWGQAMGFLGTLNQDELKAFSTLSRNGDIDLAAALASVGQTNAQGQYENRQALVQSIKDQQMFSARDRFDQGSRKGMIDWKASTNRQRQQGLAMGSNYLGQFTGDEIQGAMSDLNKRYKDSGGKKGINVGNSINSLKELQAVVKQLDGDFEAVRDIRMKVDASQAKNVLNQLGTDGKELKKDLKEAEKGYEKALQNYNNLKKQAKGRKGGKVPGLDQASRQVDTARENLQGFVDEVNQKFQEKKIPVQLKVSDEEGGLVSQVEEQLGGEGGNGYDVSASIPEQDLTDMGSKIDEQVTKPRQVPVSLSNAGGNLQVNVEGGSIPITLGPLEERAEGGLILGPGTGTSDSIPAMLSNGEYVVRAASVKKYGIGMMDKVNAGRYNQGGQVRKKGKDGDGGSGDDSDSKSKDSGSSEKKNPVKEAIEKLEDSLKELAFSLGKFGDGQKKLAEKYKNMGGKGLQKSLIAGTISADVIKKADKNGKKLKEIYEKTLKEMTLSLEVEAKIQRQTDKLTLKYMKKSAVDRYEIIANLSQEELAVSQGDAKLREKIIRRKEQQLKREERIEKKLEEAAKRKEAKESMENIITEFKDTGAMLTAASNGMNIEGLSVEDFNVAQSFGDQIADKVLGEKQDKVDKFKKKKKNADSPKQKRKMKRKLKAARGELKAEKDYSPERAKLAAQGYVEALKKQEELQRKLAIVTATAADRWGMLLDAMSQMASIEAEQIEAQAASDFVDSKGMTREQYDAELGVKQALMAQEQAQLDDINEKYDEQAEKLQEVAKNQQYIAQIEQGRLSVASALSQGDIASAAAAAQQAQASERQVAQSQRQDAFDAARKVATKPLEDSIKATNKELRDAQNELTLLDAQTAQSVANQTASWVIAQNNIKKTDQYVNDMKATVQQTFDDIEAIVGNSDWTSMEVNFNASLNNMIKEHNKFLQNVASGKQSNPATTGGGPNKKQQWQAAWGALSPNQKQKLKGWGWGPDGGRKWKKLNNAQKLKAIDLLEKKKLQRFKKNAKNFATGGWVNGRGTGDTVPAMLTPGEFVVTRRQAQRFGSLLNSINQPGYGQSAAPGRLSPGNTRDSQDVNSSVYNVTVNAATGAGADEIAHLTLRKIKEYDNMSIRNNRVG